MPTLIQDVRLPPIFYCLWILVSQLVHREVLVGCFLIFSCKYRQSFLKIRCPPLNNVKMPKAEEKWPYLQSISDTNALNWTINSRLLIDSFIIQQNLRPCEVEVVFGTNKKKLKFRTGNSPQCRWLTTHVMIANDTRDVCKRHTWCLQSSHVMFAIVAR